MCSSSDVKIASSKTPSLADRAAAGDRFRVGSLVFKRYIGRELFWNGLTDSDPVHALNVGDSFEIQDALDQRVGMLHLIDALSVQVAIQADQAPVLAHLGVQEVLIDRRQFASEDSVEAFDDAVVTFGHVFLGMAPPELPCRHSPAPQQIGEPA